MKKNMTFHKKKIWVVFLCCVLMITGLAGRLFYLMCFRSDYYYEKAKDLHERERDIKAARGKILDARGKVLASNRTVCTISVIHSQIKEPEKVISLLAQKLEMPKDQIRKTLLLQVGPPGVKVSVVDVAKAVRVYNNPKYEKDTVFFLYTCPQDVLRMAEAGVPIKSVNIGGMAFKTGKTQITKAVSVDESDIAAFKKLHEMGIELEIRPVATDKKVDLMSKIEGIEG